VRSLETNPIGNFQLGNLDSKIEKCPLLPIGFLLDGFVLFDSKVHGLHVKLAFRELFRLFGKEFGKKITKQISRILFSFNLHTDL
jgi:hypothetical protein